MACFQENSFLTQVDCIFGDYDFAKWCRLTDQYLLLNFINYARNTYFPTINHDYAILQTANNFTNF